MSYGSVNVDASYGSVNVNSFFLSSFSMRQTVMFKGKQEKAREELFTVSVEKKVIIFYHFFCWQIKYINNQLAISDVFPHDYPLGLDD